MLNKIWLALFVIGITAALATDIFNSASDKYKNGSPLNAKIHFLSLPAGTSSDITMEVDKETFNARYNAGLKDPFVQKGKATLKEGMNSGTLIINAEGKIPAVWKEIAAASGKDNDITAEFSLGSKLDSLTYAASIKLEDASFLKMKNVTTSAFDSAKTGVTIALGLIGIMALWLGIMKVAEDAGLLKKIASALRPVTKFLFPEIPQDHPAVGAMVMNISANMLGLGNAATPFGLKAMEELDKLNPEKGTATNSMCTFLAINTAGLTLIPATAIAVRAASGSTNPAIIIGTSIFGAGCATIAGITAAKMFEKISNKSLDKKSVLSSLLKLGGILILLVLAVFLLAKSGVFSSAGAVTGVLKDVLQYISIMAIPLIILAFLLFAFIKKVKVYESFVEGAKDGFNVAIKIIPYLVAMLCAIAVFRSGGGMDFLIAALTPATNLIGMPAEALPMAFLRPLSGSGSLGLMSEIMATHGPDSFMGVLVSTMFGSTETTFYVIALYFGSVNIKKTRHALAAGLIADLAGMLGALFIVRLLFGLL